jgi:hypothetical protein
MDIWTHVELLVVVVVLIVAAGLFSHYRLWPAIASIRDLADLMNTKGGVILLLGVFSAVFFFAGMRWLYWTTMLIVHKDITPDNAVIGMGFSWISGAAFGSSFGAMLNSMKGEAAPPPITATTTSTTVESKTDSKTVPPVPPTPSDAGGK